MAALRAAGDKREAVYDRDAFELSHFADGKPFAITFLHNTYAEFCKAPWGQRRKCLRRAVRALLSMHREIPEEFADAQPDLLPVVRSRSVLEFIALRHQLDGVEGPDQPCVEMGADLAAYVVYDHPETMCSITAEQLTKWGVSHYEAMEVACRNLAERATSYAAIGDGVYSVMAGDAYDSSRLLNIEFVKSLKVKGDAVALVPSRNVLLITGSEDEEGLRIVGELADKAMEDPRPISGIPLLLSADDEWTAWMPPRDHPSYDAFRLLELKTLVGEYAQQKELLTPWTRRPGLTDS
jgi:uncharacterized protein YtpQ (UPF0354 family)